MMDKNEKAKEQLLVGKTAKLLDAGYSASEIAKKLNQPESRIRFYKQMYDEYKAQK